MRYVRTAVLALVAIALAPAIVDAESVDAEANGALTTPGCTMALKTTRDSLSIVQRKPFDRNAFVATVSKAASDVLGCNQRGILTVIDAYNDYRGATLDHLQGFDWHEKMSSARTGFTASARVYHGTKLGSQLVAANASAGSDQQHWDKQ